LPYYPDFDSCLLYLFLGTVLGEVFYFPATETCFVVITPLAFFLGKSIVFLFLGLSVLGLLLRLAGYDGVAIFVVFSALSLYIGYVGAEVLLLIVSLLKPVVDARS
jgi:hypothetical protein